jgi:Na+-translocating ferredoxin:NAD+ oxidoreductase RnfC subunit
MARMDLKKFDAPAPASTLQVNLETVRIPLSMHIGKPARPIVQTGQTVAKGQLIASILENELGADIHASIKGRISEVNENYIQIESIQEVS